MTDNEVNADYALHLSNLRKFFKDVDPLIELIPQRGTHTFALHSDMFLDDIKSVPWRRTFHSLTGKDFKEVLRNKKILSGYQPKKVSIPSGTLVGDMALANAFYNKDLSVQEKAKLAKQYKDKLVPYEQANISDYKLPELLIPKSIQENFADGKVKGKSRPGRVKKAGASCKGSVTDLRAKAKKYGGERGKMYHWCANMKGGKKKKTNEEEKYTSRSKEIRDKFKQAGYKLIGTGADATVWAKKDSDQVVKIIMPEDNLGSDKSNHFIKFYEFCNSHYDLANLPKFLKVKNLNIQGQNYISVYMEKLYPIPVNSFEEAMVWILSDLSTSAKKYKQAEAAILNKNTWVGFSGLDSKSIIEQYKKLNRIQMAQYSLLFSLMKLLYHSGRVDKLGWDLHTENVMQRKDGTLVIIDPWLNI